MKRTIHPHQAPCPARVGLTEAVVVSLVAALHGAYTLEDAHLLVEARTGLLHPLVQPQRPDPRALARLLPVLHAGPRLREWIATVLGPFPSRTPLRQRIDQGRRNPASPFPDVELQPAPLGGLRLVGPGAGERLDLVAVEASGDDWVDLPVLPSDPAESFRPFRETATAILDAAGLHTPLQRRRWRAGPGQTQRGLKSVIHTAATDFRTGD